MNHDNTKSRSFEWEGSVDSEHGTASMEGSAMNIDEITRLYATVGDTQVFRPMKDGWDKVEGVQGIWTTKEGQTVLKDIPVSGPESFKLAYDKIKHEHPSAIVRFMKDQ